jgi:F-type H+-transporting ATPase subunit a
VSVANTVLGAVEWGGPWEMPEMDHLFVFPPLPGTENWGIFAINRTSIFLLLSAVLISGFFYAAFRRPDIVPDRLQAVAEAFIEFIRKLAIDVIGPEGTRFVPLLATLFAFIFLNNLFKITPFIMLPPTSRLHIPAFLALLVWLIYVGVGIKEQGAGYFREMLFPPGVPKPLAHGPGDKPHQIIPKMAFTCQFDSPFIHQYIRINRADRSKPCSSTHFVEVKQRIRI